MGIGIVSGCYTLLQHFQIIMSIQLILSVVLFRPRHFIRIQRPDLEPTRLENIGSRSGTGTGNFTLLDLTMEDPWIAGLGPEPIQDPIRYF